MNVSKSEIRDNMQIEWDVAIAMDDGIVLRADVFRPVGQGKHPVILSYGPYAKGLSFQEGYKGNWARLIEAAPEVLVGSTNKYQNWELVDPERWVPDGYACLRIELAWCRTLARHARRLVAARNIRLIPVRRMGRNAILEQRQGGDQRHFLLCDKSMDGRRAAPATPCRFVHLGRLIRLLSRTMPARRHPE